MRPASITIGRPSAARRGVFLRLTRGAHIDASDRKSPPEPFAETMSPGARRRPPVGAERSSVRLCLLLLLLCAPAATAVDDGESPSGSHPHRVALESVSFKKKKSRYLNAPF